MERFVAMLHRCTWEILSDIRDQETFQYLDAWRQQEDGSITGASAYRLSEFGNRDDVGALPHGWNVSMRQR
jgi:hypothetical protein